MPGGQVRHTWQHSRVFTETVIWSAALPHQQQEEEEKAVEGRRYRARQSRPVLSGWPTQVTLSWEWAKSGLLRGSVFPSCPDTHTQLAALGYLQAHCPTRPTTSNTVPRFSNSCVVLWHGQDQRVFHCKDKVLAKRIGILKPNTYIFTGIKPARSSRAVHTVQISTEQKRQYICAEQR